jgi:predicted lipoprotein with Yx(FWY)xxD motif
VACGGSSKATSSALPAAHSSNSAIAAASSTVGNILVGSDGKSLYLFARDRNGASSCTGPCAKSWPPYASKRAALHVGPGVKASLLHTVTRADGTKQLVYNGHPLYTYGGDTKPGDISGQGSNAFGARWYVISPQGAAVQKAASSTPKGYGY